MQQSHPTGYFRYNNRIESAIFNIIIEKNRLFFFGRLQTLVEGRVFGLRVEAMCPPTEGKTSGDLRPGERMGGPAMGQEGAQGYRVGHAEEPHTDINIYMGTPPLVVGLNVRHRGICNVPRLDVNPEIPNPSGGTMQNNSVITADLTNRTFGA